MTNQKLPEAVCALVVREDGKVLGVSRKDDSDDFGLPGGKVEAGESLEASVRRELYEETGLRTGSLVGGVSVFEAESHGFWCHTFWLCVEGEHPVIPEGNELPTDPDAEAGVIEWVDAEDLVGGTFGAYNAQLFGTFFGSGASPIEY